MSKGLGKRERDILDRLNASTKPLLVGDLLGLTRREQRELSENWRQPVGYWSVIHAVRSLARKGLVFRDRWHEGSKRMAVYLVSDKSHDKSIRTLIKKGGTA